MIHEFTVENFYSFAEKTIIRFVVNEKAPKNGAYFDTKSGARLSKIETIIGPNASGKTNLLKIIPFLKWFIIDSFATNPDALLPIKPFEAAKNQPSKLSVTFEIEKEIYVYRLEITEERVLLEELKIKNKSAERTTFKTLFIRKWNNKKRSYNLKSEGFELPSKFEALARENASLIGTAMRLNHSLSLIIGHYWEKVVTNVIEVGWVGDQLLPNNDGVLLDTMNFYFEEESIKKKAEKILARFDLGLKSFTVKRKQSEKVTTFDIRMKHSFGQREHELPLQYQSAGTRALLIHLRIILQVLSRGGVAIIDEFDVNLHPDIIIALYELFISDETNPHRAQMIFSTHSHKILSELDKYQIVLIEKNAEGSSEAWRLDEMEGVRADDNYYAKYIAGAYGAVPRIR